MLTGLCGRILAVLALSLVTVLSPSISFAEHSGDRLIVDVGLKTWVASWQAPLLFTSSDDLMHQQGSTVMLGPSLTAAFKTSDSPWFNHLFMNFTYLTNMGTFDFDYNKTNQNGAFGSVPSNPFASIKADRADLNLIVGTNVYRGLGAFVGYFSSDQTITFKQLISPGTSTLTTTSSDPRKISAIVFGMSASGDLSENLDFRGNLAGAAGTLEYRNLSRDSKPLLGWSSEVGLKWHGHLAQRFEPYVYFGFRAQVYRVNYDATNLDTINNITATRTQTLKYEDITYGPVFQIGAQF